MHLGNSPFSLRLDSRGRLSHIYSKTFRSKGIP